MVKVEDDVGNLLILLCPFFFLLLLPFCLLF